MIKEVDNFAQILDLMMFDSPNEFYFIQIIQRKKEVEGLGRSNRLVKAYYVYSKEKLKEYKTEIITLCRTLNARAYIHFNKRNDRTVALDCMKELAHYISVEQYAAINKIYNTCCGRAYSKYKSWIIDVDYLTGHYIPSIDGVLKDNILTKLATIEPIGVTKMIAKIPTVNGYHLITRPFNVEKFKEQFPDIDIHKNNPTILYAYSVQPDLSD
ncbi:MAG: hypothetical protein E6R13_01250 [Spirochaetes bacterium]|nr:MAG: hypothetical protein E6R13_01250 [Spirochaetota bacterium]